MTIPVYTCQSPLPALAPRSPAWYPAGMAGYPWDPSNTKPDNDYVDVPWNSDFKPKLIDHFYQWGEFQPDEFEFKKGALEPDVFYSGLENEIERVNLRLATNWGL